MHFPPCHCIQQLHIGIIRSYSQRMPRRRPLHCTNTQPRLGCPRGCVHHLMPRYNHQAWPSIHSIPHGNVPRVRTPHHACCIHRIHGQIRQQTPLTNTIQEHRILAVFPHQHSHHTPIWADANAIAIRKFGTPYNPIVTRRVFQRPQGQLCLEFRHNKDMITSWTPRCIGHTSKRLRQTAHPRRRRLLLAHRYNTEYRHSRPLWHACQYVCSIG
mmetsp:Transcript_5277/g.10424  ORF Transcript_5277/g.10424 Transcript_5277/m.10424 type:complete len:214 (-) Transcript_5277:241-882(-)